VARAAIDIGSNSLLLTIVDDEGNIVHDEARVVGLGRGLGDRGLFRPDRIAAAEEVLADYLQTAKQLGIEAWSIKAVATSAARRSMNAETWFAKLQRKQGLRVRIISGDEEARLTWLGSQRDLELPDGPRLVVDLGGGSTELVLGDRDQVSRRVSLEIGTVRLTERFLMAKGEDTLGMIDPGGLAKLRKHVEIEVSKVQLDPQPRVVVGVAGTVTTLAATRLGLQTYDSEKVHGCALSRVDLARFIDRLLPATPEQRREMIPSAPERADYLLAGAVILDRVLAASRRSQMCVSDRGLRFGLLA
jgi:exopolyphosphatase/guanosine-5'-triphosphate,3'-diphosphate pyrophosphatase